MASSTKSILLNAARSGDEQAWTEIYEKYWPLIRNFASGLHLQEADVEDVAQEVMLALHKGLATYDSSRPFRPWFLSIVFRKATDVHRRCREKQLVDGSGTGQFQKIPDLQQPDLEAIWEERWHKYRLAIALKILKERCDHNEYLVLVRVALNEEPTAQVAAALHMTQDNIRQIKSRLVKQLRKLFFTLDVDFWGVSNLPGNGEDPQT